MFDLLLGSLTGLVSPPPAGARVISSHRVRSGKERLEFLEHYVEMMCVEKTCMLKNINAC